MKNELQQILDAHFNGSTEKADHPQPLTNPLCSQQSWAKSIQLHSLDYKAPSSLNSGVLPTSIIDPPPTCNMNDSCVICHDPLSTGRCSALAVCKNHVFHYTCIQQALKAGPQCPVYQKPVGAPQGKSPSGKMTFMLDPQKCSDFHVNNCDYL